MKGGHVPLDDLPIRLASEGRRAVDSEPAVLIQGHPDHVDVPALHGADHLGVVDLIRMRAVEEPPALNAGVFQPRAVYAAQLDDVAAAGAIDKRVPADP